MLSINSLYSIRAKYSAIFGAIVISILAISVSDYVLTKKVENQMLEFSGKFNPAISAILNADRDLYQARVAELRALALANSSLPYQDQLDSYQENAQQALDRMHSFMDLMSDYLTVTAKLQGFEQSYREWKEASSQVFTHLDAGEIWTAEQLSDAKSKMLFGSLRDFYDIAGESADTKASELETQTLAKIESQHLFIAIFTALVVIVAMTTAYIGPKILANSIMHLARRVCEISDGDGDLTQRIRIQRRDELGTLATAFNGFIDGLNSLMTQIKNQAEDLSNHLGDLDTTINKANQVSENSDEQNQTIEVIATAVNEMSNAIREVANLVNATANEITEVDNKTHQGNDMLDQSTARIQELSNQVATASSTIQNLEEHSNSIATVVDVIQGIAEQTNLLALNAAIEAARAGEQGRGFAVVADEVRNLASKTQQSTEDIQTMIQSLQSGVKEAVNAIENSVEGANQTVELSQKTKETLAHIMEATNKVSEMAIQASTATEEQSRVAEDINETLTKLADQTHESSDLADETRSVVSVMKSGVQQLSSSVSRFIIN